MAALRTTPAELQQAVAALKKHGTKAAAARALGVPIGTFKSRLNAAELPIPPAEGSAVASELKRLRKEVHDAQKISATSAAILDAVGSIRSNTDKLEPPTWVSAPLATPSSPGVPTLFLSDIHHGERVFPAQIGGVNKFNMEISRKRLHYTVETAIELCRIISPKMDYPGIVTPLGGDMISGNLHDELTATNEVNTMPVLLDLYGELIGAITRLADVFGSVFLPCVTGNHGRDTRKIWAKDRQHTSFDWLLYHFLAKHFAGDKRVKFYIPDGSDALYRVWDYKYLLSHGDQFRGGDSIIGCLGPLTRGNQKKRSRNQQIGMGYDTLCVGHWHQYIHTRTLIVNGSIKGYDEYAYTNNFSYEDPQQALWLTHPRHGITFRMPVNCERGEVRAATPWASVQA
jgi:hypothetical protein